MADTLNFKKGVASALPAASNGQILFTTDTNELYIDDAGSHKQINANNAKSADKLNTNAGDSNTPVYFSNGKPVACTGLDLDTSGNAATTTKLATARTITTNLASTAAASFDGSADVTPGVTGVLPIAHGGTGASDALSGYYNLAWRGTPTSLNDASSIGFYKINPDVTNTPYASMWGACMLLTDDAKTTGNTSGSVWQMAFTTASTDLHLRCRTNGTDWQGWHKLLTSNNYSDYCAPREHTHSYLPLAGGTMTGRLKFAAGDSMPNFNSPAVVATYVNNDSAQGLGYANTSTLSVGYSSSAGAVQSINPSSQSIASRITYISGGFNLGTGDNQIQIDGMTGDPNHISAPAAGCYHNGISGNVQVVRFAWPSSNYWTELYMSPNYDGFWHSSVKNGTRSSWKRIWMQGDSVTGAVWNDYAEYRESDCEEFGYVLMEVGDDSLTKTTERLSHFAGVSSDTWGFSQGETEKAKTPIAVAGRVLVYPYQDRNNYKPGDCVCAAPGGTVDIMTREEVINWPDRIVGTVSCVPEYEEWGGGRGADRDPVQVNNRIWIKIK